MKISVVTPVYNERKNLEPLLSQIKQVLDGVYEYEIIAVDDNSSDGSQEVLKQFASKNQSLKTVSFSRNYGQTAAIMAGIHYSSGDIIVPIDSDLENDPHDIYNLLKKIREGNDIVSGWRKNRWEKKFFTRKLPSVCANWLISKITGVALHDYGCTLKAYKREFIGNVALYGEMHRFLPAYAAFHGARISEVSVHYRPRTYGASKYGISRMFKVLLDLLVFRFLYTYMTKPIHFFGGVGFVSLFLGVVTGVTAVVLKMADLKDFIETPLPILSALLIIVGVQFIGMGIIAEMLMRVYYEGQNKKIYTIKETTNI